MRHVDAALRALDGGRAAQVRRREGTVRVEHDAARAPVAAMIAALRDAGYASSPAAA